MTRPSVQSVGAAKSRGCGAGTESSTAGETTKRLSSSASGARGGSGAAASARRKGDRPVQRAAPRDLGALFPGALTMHWHGGLKGPRGGVFRLWRPNTLLVHIEGLLCPRPAAPRKDSGTEVPARPIESPCRGKRARSLPSARSKCGGGLESWMPPADSVSHVSPTALLGHRANRDASPRGWGAGQKSGLGRGADEDGLGEGSPLISATVSR